MQVLGAMILEWETETTCLGKLFVIFDIDKLNKKEKRKINFN